MSFLKDKKREFLQKYNPNRDDETALKSAINAAVQRNLLYAKSIEPDEKKQVREGWAESLLDIAKEFQKEVSLAHYEQLVLNLQKQMNHKYRGLFNSGSRHGSMFRISHSQKSIAVCVKHLWCLGKIPEPKICPVDRIILRKTSAAISGDIAWGYVNSIEELRRKFNYIIEEANKSSLTVAQWELLSF